MKISFEEQGFAGGVATREAFSVRGETEPLRHVLLCAPSHLSAVPCCSVTQESLRNGFEASREVAMRQHDALRRTLSEKGVECRMLAAMPRIRCSFSMSLSLRGFPGSCRERSLALAFKRAFICSSRLPASVLSTALICFASALRSDTAAVYVFFISDSTLFMV